MTDQANDTTTPEIVIDEVKVDIKEYEAMKTENDRLKSFHDKVLDEKKQSDIKAKDAEAKATTAKAEAEGDFKKLLELKDTEIHERDTRLNVYENEKKESKVMAEALRLAQELAKSSPAKAALLAKELRGRMQLTEDGIKVIDENGKMISDKLETLSDYAKKNYDFLCDGLQSTGGAGVQAAKPTGEAQNPKLDVVDRLNAALGAGQ